jgi:hypothetical protein
LFDGIQARSFSLSERLLYTNWTLAVEKRASVNVHDQFCRKNTLFCGTNRGTYILFNDKGSYWASLSRHFSCIKKNFVTGLLAHNEHTRYQDPVYITLDEADLRNFIVCARRLLVNQLVQKNYPFNSEITLLEMKLCTYNCRKPFFKLLPKSPHSPTRTSSLSFKAFGKIFMACHLLHLSYRVKPKVVHRNRITL